MAGNPHDSYYGRFQAEQAQKQRQEQDAMMQGPQQGACVGISSGPHGPAVLGAYAGPPTANAAPQSPPLAERADYQAQQIAVLQHQLGFALERIAELERFTGAGGR